MPAILLDGPKAVGKTSTSYQHHRTLYRVDEATRRELLAADLNRIKKDEPPVLIDEWQLLPQIWDTVRRAVDEDQTPGRFILTGSIPGSSTHSGAARVANVRVRPLALAERFTASPTVSMTELVSDPNAKIEGETSVELNNYVDEILTGGLPAMRSLSGRPLRRQLDSYLDRIVDHDLAEADFNVRKPQTVTAWLRAYAAATATTAT